LVLPAILAGPALACAGLIGPRGSVDLGRTTTLAAYHAGVEHYVTAFQYSGGGGKFGSIVPLPGIPSKVERGGDWTLQRLLREVQPPIAFAAAPRAEAASADKAEEISRTRIDALDIIVLRGGSAAVGQWAKEHEFLLPPDAPEVLDFYARRSQIFMAAVFDADAARERGQQVGDGTPVHLTIPARNPWVPLRILSLGKPSGDVVDAEVFLLTDTSPALLPEAREGFRLERREPASTSLLNDLRSDKGMEWIPESMWLTHFVLSSSAGNLKYDLAVDASGRGRPSRVAAGLAAPAPPRTPRPSPAPTPVVTPAPTPEPVATPGPTFEAAPVIPTASRDARPWLPVAVAAFAATIPAGLLVARRVRSR
jgi:hypothetical protein